MSEDRFNQYEKKYPGRLRAILEGKIVPDLTRYKAEAEAVDQASSPDYINDYHKQQSEGLKRVISQQQPVSREKFDRQYNLANPNQEPEPSEQP
jgi:hypothetical protein